MKSHYLQITCEIPQMGVGGQCTKGVCPPHVLKKEMGMAYDIHSGNLQLDRVIALSTRKTFIPAW